MKFQCECHRRKSTNGGTCVLINFLYWLLLHHSGCVERLVIGPHGSQSPNCGLPGSWRKKLDDSWFNLTLFFSLYLVSQVGSVCVSSRSVSLLWPQKGRIQHFFYHLERWTRTPSYILPKVKSPALPARSAYPTCRLFLVLVTRTEAMLCPFISCTIFLPSRTLLCSLSTAFSAKRLMGLIPMVLGSHVSFLIFQGSPRWRHMAVSSVTLTRFLLGLPPETLGFSQNFCGLQTSFTFSKYFNTTNQNKTAFSGCRFLFLW